MQTIPGTRVAVREKVLNLTRCLGLALLSTASLLLGAGCVMPAPVLRLTPQSRNVVWIGGTAVTSQQGKNIRAAVAFVREQDNLLSFRVEIESVSDRPILVDPSRFYYLTCAQRRQPPTRVCNGSRYVVNPEQVLLDLDVANSRQAASAANAEAFFGAMFLLQATAGIAGAASGHGHGGAGVAMGATRTAYALDSVQHERRRQVSAYELDRANWSTAALRKSTLLLGDSVAGLVFLEKDPSVSEVSLQIRAGDDVLPFGFNQTAHQVRFENHRGSHSAEGMNM